MRGVKPSLALAAMAVMGLAVWASAVNDSSGGQMASAAGRILAALDKEQIAKVEFPFDSPERINWHFIPRERKGLSVKEMTPAQRALMFGLLEHGPGCVGLREVDDDHEPGADPVGFGAR